MSDDATTQTGSGDALPYQSQRPPRLPRAGIPRRAWKISEVICWLIILLIVGLVSTRAAMVQQNFAATPEPAPQFPGMCKMAVGLKSAEATLHAAGAGNAQRLLLELDTLAKTPRERLELAIVYGEIDGPDAAAKRLAQITAPPKDPQFAQDLAEARALYSVPNDHAVPLPNAPGQQRVQEFRQRLGWFANLALSLGKPNTDPVRRQVLSDAFLTMIVIAGGELLLFVAVAAGLVLLIIAIVQLARGKLRLAFRTTLDAQTPHADGSAYLHGFTWYLVLMIGFSLLLNWLGARWIVTAAIELPGAFAVGILWPLFRGESIAQWRATLGLHAGRGIFREIFNGIAGYIAGFPLIGLSLLVVLLLTHVAGYTPTHPIEQELGGTAGIVFAFFAASIWAPVTEELMFRGALFASLRERFNWWIAAPVMALVFAGMHPQGFVAVPVLAAIAITFAGIREWRGSIIGSMAAHSLHNTLTLVVLLFLMRS